MATSATHLSSYPAHHILGVTRMFMSGGATAAAIFVTCWIGTFIPLSNPTHAYISLFTTAAASSGRALLEGLVWSLPFGALSGALFALIYNAFAALDRR